MKELSIRQRNRRKYRNMYQSFQVKLLENDLIWFNSLSMKSRYHVIFRWYSLKKTTPNIKLKHFINDYKPRYKATILNRRNAIIEHFLD